VEIQKINQMLSTYLRPQTFPLAIKLVSSEKELPPKAKMPKRDFNKKMALCQSNALARRSGWLLALGFDDMNCPVGAITLGFAPAVAEFLDGNLDIPWWADQQSRAKMAAGVPKIEVGKYKYIVIAPLERADFEPHVILIYGNAAQMSRLAQSQTYCTGEPIVSTCVGAFGCSVEISKPILTQQCHITVPGGGERAIGQAETDELCFSIPGSKIESIITGLEATHKAGIKYPVATYLSYEAEFPKGYVQLMDHLAKEKPDK
jgi:uncharacterized protein (DUF169 family)